MIVSMPACQDLKFSSLWLLEFACSLHIKLCPLLTTSRLHPPRLCVWQWMLIGHIAFFFIAGESKLLALRSGKSVPSEARVQYAKIAIPQRGGVVSTCCHYKHHLRRLALRSGKNPTFCSTPHTRNSVS